MSYDECLALAKGYFAFSILTEINEKGEEFVMTNIRHVLQSKQYPNVHKREPIQ